MSLHKYMLPLWGMPIGELWDMEALSEKCKKENRYTFLLSSSPADVPGMLSCFYCLSIYLPNTQS
jgi:hypothetical protein